MALVLLPGLTNLIDDISEEKKLPPQVVEAALREALLKGYERYRRTLSLGDVQQRHRARLHRAVHDLRRGNSLSPRLGRSERLQLWHVRA